MIALWKVWLDLKDMNHVAGTLRKAQLDKRLLVSIVVRFSDCWRMKQDCISIFDDDCQSSQDQPFYIKTKSVVFYFLSNALDLIWDFSGSKFKENPNSLK